MGSPTAERAAGLYCPISEETSRVGPGRTSLTALPGPMTPHVEGPLRAHEGALWPYAAPPQAPSGPPPATSAVDLSPSTGNTRSHQGGPSGTWLVHVKPDASYCVWVVAYTQGRSYSRLAFHDYTIHARPEKVTYHSSASPLPGPIDSVIEVFGHRHGLLIIM